MTHSWRSLQYTWKIRHRGSSMITNFQKKIWRDLAQVRSFAFRQILIVSITSNTCQKNYVNWKTDIYYVRFDYFLPWICLMHVSANKIINFYTYKYILYYHYIMFYGKILQKLGIFTRTPSSKNMLLIKLLYLTSMSFS